MTEEVTTPIDTTPEQLKAAMAKIEELSAQLANTDKDKALDAVSKEAKKWQKEALENKTKLDNQAKAIILKSLSEADHDITAFEHLDLGPLEVTASKLLAKTKKKGSEINIRGSGEDKETYRGPMVHSSKKGGPVKWDDRFNS